MATGIEGHLALFGMLFVLGTLQGLTFCNLTCGPLFVLRLAEGGWGVRKGAKLAVLFSLPRIVLLTSLGALAGLAGGSIGALSEVKGTIVLRTTVYLLLGGFMVLSGVSFIRTKGGEGRRHCSPGVTLFQRLVARLGRRTARSEALFMFGVGILVSTVCVTEASVVVLAAASFVGIGAESMQGGALLGGLAMLSYALGLSVPLLALGSLSSELGRRMQRDDVRKVGGLLLCLFGAGLISLTLASLFI